MVKPGKCPNVPIPLVMVRCMKPVDKCHHDGDCKGNMKCCRIHYCGGLECTRPVPGTSVGSRKMKLNKGKFLYSAASSPQDRSKRFTLYFPDRPVHSDTISASLWSIQPDATINGRRLLVHTSTSVSINKSSEAANSSRACWMFFTLYMTSKQGYSNKFQINFDWNVSVIQL